MSDITLEARADNNVTSPRSKEQWMPREASPLAHVEFITPDQLYQETSVDIREIKGLSHFILRGKQRIPLLFQGLKRRLAYRFQSHRERPFKPIVCVFSGNLLMNG